MIAYLDASSLTALVLGDPGVDAIGDWAFLIAPVFAYSDFGWGEMISALGLRVRTGTLSREAALAASANAVVMTAEWARERTDPLDIEDATAMVMRFELKLRLPDAIHVATAKRLGATLVTNDMRQASAARELHLRVFNPLEQQVTGS